MAEEGKLNRWRLFAELTSEDADVVLKACEERNLVGGEELFRENDPGDRRRTLIWLTPGGHEALRRDREVLDVDLLARALARLPPGQADALNAAMRALIECSQSDGVRASGGESHGHDVKL